MNAHKEWMAEISEIDEFFGREPRYPHTLLQSHIQKELNKQNEVIRNSNSEIRESIINSTSDISGTLENGFNMMIEVNTQGFESVNENIGNLQNEVTQGFDNIVYELNKINSTLNWGFSKIIELNKQRNILLDDIVGLLNIPDIEKVRKLNIEKGINFLKKSIIDVTFLDDAKSYFEKALELEPNDYYVLYNLGIIHLFSVKFLDFEKAKNYFLKAGKYSNADIMFSRVKYSTHSSSFKNKINPKTIATYSFLYASRCYYNLNNQKEALNTVAKAHHLSPNIIEVAYDTAKYFICNNELNASITVLSDAIELDRFVTLKVLKDLDFMKRKEIPQFLKQLKNKKIKEGQAKYVQCERIIRNDSIEMKSFNKASNNLQKNTFLGAMSALDIL